MKKPVILIALITICGYAFGQTAAKISAIPKPISWDVQPLSFVTGPKSITIKAGKETDLYTFADGRFYINNAPKMLFTPDTAFIMSVKITPDFKNEYDGGALLIYSNKENWAKLLFEKNEDGSLGLGASLVNNKHGDDSYHIAVNSGSVYTKVARSGDFFVFYYSLDGKSWKIIRSLPYAKSADLRVGFYAQSPKGESCTVKFEDISYDARPFKNFSTGE
ncbi:DUF1349 domain-containing protein [Pedobacter sp. HMF7647]|uniref:DUF1349 domain-containing protein n=1 Tax=Hufsiella arboris TaxID=2695275 RepID=A0A7K1Y8L0_9SPHI|nr:DUF1349 domain-containing protein [Hufsiella arboris]MXV50711.1 DUF1349 domain-containing protein [Hufsiella arboris]